MSDEKDPLDELFNLFDRIAEDIIRKTYVGAYGDQIVRIEDVYDEEEYEAVSGFAGAFIGALETQGFEREEVKEALERAFDSLEEHKDAGNDENQCDICGDVHKTGDSGE